MLRLLIRVMGIGGTMLGTMVRRLIKCTPNKVKVLTLASISKRNEYLLDQGGVSIVICHPTEYIGTVGTLDTIATHVPRGCMYGGRSQLLMCNPLCRCQKLKFLNPGNMCLSRSLSNLNLLTGWSKYSDLPSHRICWHCGNPGHYRHTCPKRVRVWREVPVTNVQPTVQASKAKVSKPRKPVFVWVSKQP